MENMLSNTSILKSSISILTCRGDGSMATKEFYVSKDGYIGKKSFSAGMFFKYEEKQVSCLQDLANILEDLLNSPRKFIIKGKAKELAGEIVRRRIHGPDAAFVPVARPYVMLDIDKKPYPDYLDVTTDPEAIVRWILDMLPDQFRNASCYYKFSSSQNITESIDNLPKKEASLHLWFWCNRAVSDAEWKRFFKDNHAPVDNAIFSPVQIHYTANPIFTGIDDPLPKRSGIFKGEHDSVNIPPIALQENRTFSSITRAEPKITAENREKALTLLLPHYVEGVRNRFCGAIAGALYRGGWNADNVADFIYELADLRNDSESNERYKNALQICEAIDDGRPAQGIPTLRKEFSIDDLEEILNLLGIGKPNINMLITGLFAGSDIGQIKEVIRKIATLSSAEQKNYIDRIKSITNYPKGTLNALLKEVREESFVLPPLDWPDRLMEWLLEYKFANGSHLIKSSDGIYWKYNGRYWVCIPEDLIKKEMLPLAREIVLETEYKRESHSLISSAMKLLGGQVSHENDPLHRSHDNISAVINCQNGEVWFDEKGMVNLKPHRADSYLQHCLNVEYDPTATAPMFKKATLEIFANSTNPEDMFRHFMELAGYICQPWRKIAVIVLLYGGGNNGKTSLVKILIRILGNKAVMSDRISDIETNNFKVGSLDGKLMLLDDDVDDGTCLPDGFLKKISEEKMMTGQHKYRPPFEFVCRAVPVMLANAYPSIKDLTEGIRRRVMVIPFARRFETYEIKTELFDVIWEQESSGILNDIIEGFKRLRQRGKFNEPEDCAISKREWLIRSNVLPTFIEEACQKGEKLKQPVREFYISFRQYCDDSGIRNIPTRQGFAKRLASLGYKISQLDGEEVVNGIKSDEKWRV